MINFQNKNIVIIGLGITGLSCVDYFLSKNIIPKVIDTRLSPPNINKIDKRICVHLGSLNEDWILSADILVISPGLPLNQTIFKKAQANGAKILGDIELFCLEVNKLENKKIVAITGSNGKTTVTSLVWHILNYSGLKVAMGGNIGTPALNLLKDDYDVYVLELSSFQLETTHHLKADVATILNITEDHMDRYAQDITQYQDVKQRIYKMAKCIVYNHDDKLTYPKLNQNASKQISIGIDQGDYHLNDENTWLQKNNDTLINVNKLQLSGLHNYFNALTALAIADELGVLQSKSLDAIKTFKGLAHRFELVHKNQGVDWINDSKATNVGSTVAALNSVICKGTLYLLLGGDGKAADFSSLTPELVKHKNIKIYCFGQDKNLLAKLKPSVSIVTDSLSSAIKSIVTQIKKGDVVLLSPACASIDQFSNYIERGELFTSLAKEFG